MKKIFLVISIIAGASAMAWGPSSVEQTQGRSSISLHERINPLDCIDSVGACKIPTNEPPDTP